MIDLSQWFTCLIFELSPAKTQVVNFSSIMRKPDNEEYYPSDKLQFQGEVLIQVLSLWRTGFLCNCKILYWSFLQNNTHIYLTMYTRCPHEFQTFLKILWRLGGSWEVELFRKSIQKPSVAMYFNSCWEDKAVADRTGIEGFKKSCGVYSIAKGLSTLTWKEP